MRFPVVSDDDGGDEKLLSRSRVVVRMLLLYGGCFVFVFGGDSCCDSCCDNCCDCGVVGQSPVEGDDAEVVATTTTPSLSQASINTTSWSRGFTMAMRCDAMR